ncbi:MAG: winged helix-turn-helix transcriptional regulator [Thaumarchaeota archaeon]|nr:winged helix-turn-helix transcriptional regulator [Nitrososphaerota archaeon]
MDTLDVRIIRQILQDASGSPFTSDPKWTYRRISKALGVDEGTIRTRMKKLEDSGFLKGWYVIPNPGLLGMEITQVWLDFLGASRKDDLIRKLQLVDGVVLVVNFSGNSLYFVIIYDSDNTLKRRLELVQRFANPEGILGVKSRFPRCEVKLSASDHGVLQQLHKNPRSSYAEVAKTLGLSTRTVKRRLASMIRGRAIFVVPRVDPKSLKGAIIADLLVHYASQDQRRRLDALIAEEFEDKLMRVELTSENVSFFNFVVTNLAQAQEILDWVKNTPGVATARIDLVQDRIENYDRLWEKFGFGLARESAIKA